MSISLRGLQLIERFEGLRLTVYGDSRGLPTIGIGHKLLPGESYPDGISEAQAYELLRQDAAWAEHAVNAYVRVPLTQDQFDALVSFTFNLGSGTLEHSSVLTHINADEFDLAASAMLLYCHCGGKVVDGLLLRRKAEAALLYEDSPIIHRRVIGEYSQELITTEK